MIDEEKHGLIQGREFPKKKFNRSNKSVLLPPTSRKGKMGTDF